MRRFFTGFWRELALPVAIVLLLFAGGAAQLYLEVPPAETYQDRGVFTFTASSGYSAPRRGHWQKKYHRWSTRYVYVVIYKASGGWRWEQDFLIEGEGKEAIQNREQVERRVLSIVGENTYVTVSPELTPQRYVAKERQRYLILGCACLAAAAAEGVIWLYLHRKKAGSSSPT